MKRVCTERRAANMKGVQVAIRFALWMRSQPIS
jgi:hypothetical protein